MFWKAHKTYLAILGNPVVDIEETQKYKHVKPVCVKNPVGNTEIKSSKNFAWIIHCLKSGKIWKVILKNRNMEGEISLSKRN